MDYITYLLGFKQSDNTENHELDDLENPKKAHQASQPIDFAADLALYTGCKSKVCCYVGTPNHKINSFKNFLIYGIVQKQFVDTRRICESYFVSVQTLMWVRIVMALYVAIVLFNTLIESFWYGYWFAYFTNMSYLGLVIYVWTSAYLSFRCWKSPARLAKSPSDSLIFECLISVLYTTCFVFHILVPLVYWVGLRGTLPVQDDTAYEAWLNISVHGLDILIVLVELCLNRIIFSWGHFVIAIVILLLYTFWAWVWSAIHPTFGFRNTGFPYGFLNYNDPFMVLYWVVMLATLFAIWSLSFLIHLARAKISQIIHHQREIKSKK